MSVQRGVVERAPYVTHVRYAEVFDAQECEQIVRAGLALPEEPAGVEGDDGPLGDGQVRAAQIAWMAPGEELGWVVERLARLCDDANEVYGFDLTGFDEDLQFTTYRTPGSFYTWHQDGLDTGVAMRKLSIVVQLTDPSEYDGADLELFQVVEDHDDAELAEIRAASRAQGTAVVFPAFEYHRVTPLERGVRHSLVCWVSGPPFR
jgi:PKHD-type hydroxylase